MPPNGYAWWYLDAVSDDRAHALTIIFFIGSVFSPYYAFSRRRGPADPTDHCAVNVALYGRQRHHWTMTERSRGSLRRSPTELRIGPSKFLVEETGIRCDLNEIAVPIPATVRGRATVSWQTSPKDVYPLDQGARHHWRPVAPRARIEVAFDRPSLVWTGDAYLDMNWGVEPLENRFSRWTWSRSIGDDNASIIYDIEERGQARRCIGVSCRSDGSASRFDPPAEATTTQLRRGFWGAGRATRCDEGTRPKLLRTLEDAPFYTRSLIDAKINGSSGERVHESVDLDRFRHPIVQAMLPFRMPRRATKA